MSISAHYPVIFKQEPAYQDDAKAGVPDSTAKAFAQWPEGGDGGDAAAALRLANRMYESRPLYQPAGQARRPVPAAHPDPLLDAYRAAVVDPMYLDGRLEDDDALMLRLAAAAGLPAGTPAMRLTSGQREGLLADLIRAFTRGIDWKAVLGPDPNDAGAVYYDGLTLRNAGGKPLAQVNEGLEARIRRVLQARGIAGIAGIAHCAGLARQVRRTLTADPTLSLQPPPEVAYGGPRWIALWTGMRTLAEQGLDPARRDADELVAVGRAAMAEQVRRARPEAAGHEAGVAAHVPSAAAPPIAPGIASEAAAGIAPGIDVGGLLLMAHAAGRLDLRAIAQGRASVTAGQLTACYQETFAAELRLLDALKSLEALKPPTGRQAARDRLRAAGIDPDHSIDVDSLFIPAAYGPLRISIPLPFTLYKQSICDFYMARGQLRLEALEGVLPTGAAAARAVPEAVARARARLALPLKDQFDIEFDRHKAATAGQVARVVDTSIALYAERRGIDVSGAFITVSRAQRRIALEVQRYISPLPSVQLEQKDSEGYFVSMDTPGGQHRYFLSLATAEQVTLPAAVSIADWCRDNARVVFDTAGEADGAGGTLLDRLAEIALSHTYPVKELASAKGHEMVGPLEVALAATLEPGRADAYGTSAVEQLRELERGLVPFRSTFLAIRSGQTDELPTMAALDALVFLPAMGEGLSLGWSAVEAAAAGIERALDTAAREGIVQAIKLGAMESASFAPSLGRHAANVAWTAAQAAMVNPVDILAALRGGGRLGMKGMSAVVERLKATRPLLAKDLSESMLGGALARYRVTAPDLQAALDGAARSGDGTFQLGSKRYALIGGHYLELAVDHPTTTRDRPIWRVVGAGLPGTRLGAPSLSWDKDLGAWREAETPRLKGGGMQDRPAAAPSGQSAAGNGIRLGPSDEQLARFHDILVSGIQGEATAEQVTAVRSALRRIQEDRRGKAILRAMYARHELLGEAPSIALRGTSGRTESPVAPKRLAPGPVWHMNLDEAAADTAQALVRDSALAYEAMTGLLEEDRAGLRMGRPLTPAERPFGTLLAQGQSLLDPALEAAWSNWLAKDPSNLAAAAFIDVMRGQLREARCYGGQQKLALKRLMTEAIEQYAGTRPLFAFNRIAQQPSALAMGLRAARRTAVSPNILHEIDGLRIDLSRPMRNDVRLRSVPPLPDDVTVLQVARHAIVDWTNLPAGLKSLDASSNDLADLPAGLPSGLIDLRLADNRLAMMSEALPPALKNLNLASNPSLRTLPRLPDSLRALDASMSGLTELPVYLPPNLETLTLFRNSLTRLPDALPASLRSLVVPNNALIELPRSLPPGLRHLDAKGNRLTALPSLPDSLEALYVTSNQIAELPDRLPGSLYILDAARNTLRRLPDSLPPGLLDVRLNDNRIASLPASVRTLTSATISLENNPLSVQDIPPPAPGMFGPRIFFSVHEAGGTAAGSGTLDQAVRAMLGDGHAEAVSRWQAIEQSVEAGSEEAGSMAEFRVFLDRLRATAGYRDAALRTEVRNWLVELSKPERQSLLRTTLGICRTSTTSCQDRVAWTLNEVFKARANDDILSGRHDGRPGDVVDIARQMFRLDELGGIARRKAASMTVVDEVEVYLGFLVKLRPSDKLGLNLLVPDMNYFASAGLTQQDLDDALRIVRESESAGFDSFFVTRYEPWQALLRRKFGARYEQAVDKLADLPFDADFKRQVDAKLAEGKLAADDADARRAAERAVESEMRYRALAPLTREYLASAGVVYRPAG
jgi:Leucine-rich repeat (LRR) protein